jgi:hypothetical protein
MNTFSPFRLIHRTGLQRGALFGGILLAALLAFEIFNYSTTDFALSDLLGNDLKFAGIRWATILSLAFCGIDFAGLARLFTPEHGRDEPAEVWYLFGAWFLAAAMNAILTWWGVAVAINNHTALGSTLVDRALLARGIPVFVAMMVWIIRILIIGTFSMAGERIFSMAEGATRRPAVRGARPATTASYRPVTSGAAPRRVVRPEPQPTGMPFRPAPKPEPTYHPVGIAARQQDDSSITRR